MGTLANISTAEAVRAFQKAGFTFSRTRGSHNIMIKAGHRKSLAIPERRELASGTLRALIRDANLTVSEFLALL